MLRAHNRLLLLQYKFSGGDFGKQYDPLGACNNDGSSNPEEVADAVFVGCFKGVFGERTMKFEYKNKETLTNEVKSVGERRSHTFLWRNPFFFVGGGEGGKIASLG